ncbi:MAG TPA: hypothetical protein VE172_04590 [Stackebrandtia sp.]|uniref:hypothetical protein n=1 Tax=Stackebrandtia sp. TaxID=2023065 RepID=UPI002D2FB166|nr:hypothetical protein [Stackebrandtia sp.]HZE38071.1 hypothetical protein [Stackebrandtia sp.]
MSRPYGVVARAFDERPRDPASTKASKPKTYYEKIPGICAKLDWSSYADIAPEIDGNRLEGPGGSMNAPESFECSTLFQEKLDDKGVCIECVSVSEDFAVFEKGHSKAVKGEWDFDIKYLEGQDAVAPGQTVKFSEFQGKWEQGESWCLPKYYEGYQRKDGSQCVVMIMDGNMVIQYELSVATDKQPDRLDPSTMLDQISDGVRDAQKLLAR